MRAALALIILAACTTAEPTGSQESAVSVERTQDQTTTRIRVNGQAADVILSDPNTNTNGFLYVSYDQVNNVSALDFSYATPTNDPLFIVLTQGAGEIPNSAFIRTSDTAQLLLPTTPFPVIRCTVNLDTGEFACVEGAPIAFDLFWEVNGFALVDQYLRRTEVTGPLTTKFRGTFVQRSALVNGTWNGNTATDISGNLTDTKSTTVIREITMQMN
jgi:hypothetical protein